MSRTKKEYEEYLNDMSPEQGSDEWIIGGELRKYWMSKNQYGAAIRTYDPIAFEVGYNEFKKR
jgi:hypothetical protein